MNPQVKEYLPAEVHFFQSSFDEYGFPENSYDLINAQYALPFNKPETFNEMFTRLKGSLKSGGVFVGQFFGPEDTWATDPHMTFHSKEEVEKLFEGFMLVHLEEEKKRGRTALGKEKFWHVIHVIAKKN